MEAEEIDDDDERARERERERARAGGGESRAHTFNARVRILNIKRRYIHPVFGWWTGVHSTYDLFLPAKGLIES